MTFDQAAIILLLILALALFIWGKWRYDVVAIWTLFLSAILGLVKPDQIFSGFGHPATITVALVLILGYALTRSGAVDAITMLLSPLKDLPVIQMVCFIFLAAFLSMFLNNVGALALIMPLAISSSINAKQSPSSILMPLSFGSILGGLVTLIGTPPNIIISSYRQQLTGTPFGMFDFAPVGGIVALMGVIFLSTIGWRMVRVRKKSGDKDLLEIESYLFELRVPENSKLITKGIEYIDDNLGDINVQIISLVYKNKHYNVIPKQHQFARGDLILIEGSQEQVDRFNIKFKTTLVGADSARSEILHTESTDTIEIVIAPDSRLINRSVDSVRFKSYYNVNLLAVYREGLTHRARLREFKLHSGDVLLLHGDRENLESAIPRLGCFPLMRRVLDFGKRRFALLALAIFLSAIGVSILGWLSIQAALLMAVILMVLFKLISPTDLYDGIDWPVIVLLGAMIPVGQALESSGTTELIADGLLNLTAGAPHFVILAMLLIITMTLSDVLNNAATAILMAPIGKSIADNLSANPDPFLIAVALGASCAFLTPIGHQNNALIMGPGGYKFTDYWRLGLPLEILIVIIGIPLILYFWPLYPF